MRHCFAEPGLRELSPVRGFSRCGTEGSTARCVVTRQREYGDRQRHSLALSLLDELITRQQLSSIEIETDWPNARNLLIPTSTNALSADHAAR
jgi:hypothetical protein